MKYVISAIILIAFCFYSCSNSKEMTHELKLSANDKVEIFIGPKISCETKCMQLIRYKEKDLLAYQNKGEIYFFDLNGNLFHTIKYEAKGPNGIEGLRGFFFVDFDTIYTFPGIPWYFFHTDSSGQVIKKMDITNLKVDSGPACINDDFYFNPNEMVKKNNNLYLPTYLYDYNLENEIVNYSTGIIYDTKTDQSEFSPYHYPPIDPTQYMHSRTHGNNRWVYSFSNLNKLFLFNMNKKSQSRQCKSRYAPDKIPKYQTNPDIEKEVHNTVTNPSYYGILFDKYKKIYYRLFYPGIEVDKNTELSKYFSLIESPKLFSVIILNENLEVIGETLMPEDSYNPYMNFINKDGLHFALHVNHPDFDPDYLKFARFSVEKINNPNQ
jgi:hypothetical protein